jgi:translation initiation factor IF-1
MEPTQAIVNAQKSFTRYIVELTDGKEIEVLLSAKYPMNGINLSIGAKVFVLVLDNYRADGRILTYSDFKLNGWPGWTEEHEPY